MVIEVMGQLLALASVCVFGLLLHRFTPLDASLACLLSGFLAGLLQAHWQFDTGLRASNLKDLVFFVILPVLIFEAAWHLKPSLLKRWLVPILLLATVGVLVSTFVTAALVYVGIGHSSGFPWAAALLVGAILAATDPVAVTAQLKARGAPEDLATLFEGESLFNDASVVVLFLVVINLATGAMGSHDSYLGFFGAVFVGGIIFGVVTGLLVSAVILLLGQASASRFILVFAAFASFFVAEHILHVSGIMAVMMTAIIAKLALHDVRETIANGVAETWQWLGLYLNSVLFVIMGLVIGIDMFVDQWQAILIAIVATLIGRVVAVYGVAALSGLLGKPIPLRWQLLLVWGGLRGAIAIALVLSLPISLSYWWVVQSMVFGVVVFSLLVQATTNSLLLKKYAALE